MVEAVLSAVRVVSELWRILKGERRIGETYYAFQLGAPVQLAPQLKGLGSVLYVQRIMYPVL